MPMIQNVARKQVSTVTAKPMFSTMCPISTTDVSQWNPYCHRPSNVSMIIICD